MEGEVADRSVVFRDREGVPLIVMQPGMVGPNHPHYAYYYCNFYSNFYFYCKVGPSHPHNAGPNIATMHKASFAMKEVCNFSTLQLCDFAT